MLLCDTKADGRLQEVSNVCVQRWILSLVLTRPSLLVVHKLEDLGYAKPSLNDMSNIAKISSTSLTHVTETPFSVPARSCLSVHVEVTSSLLRKITHKSNPSLPIFLWSSKMSNGYCKGPKPSQFAILPISL